MPDVSSELLVQIKIALAQNQTPEATKALEGLNAAAAGSGKAVQDLNEETKKGTEHTNQFAKAADKLYGSHHTLRHGLMELGREIPGIGLAMQFAFSGPLAAISLLTIVIGKLREQFAHLQEIKAIQADLQPVSSGIYSIAEAMRSARTAAGEFLDALTRSDGPKKLADDTNAAIAAIKKLKSTQDEERNAKLAMDIAQVDLDEDKGKISAPDAIKKRLAIRQTAEKEERDAAIKAAKETEEAKAKSIAEAQAALEAGMARETAAREQSAKDAQTVEENDRKRKERKENLYGKGPRDPESLVAKIQKLEDEIAQAESGVFNQRPGKSELGEMFHGRFVLPVDTTAQNAKLAELREQQAAEAARLRGVPSHEADAARAGISERAVSELERQLTGLASAIEKIKSIAVPEVGSEKVLNYKLITENIQAQRELNRALVQSNRDLNAQVQTIQSR